VLTYAREHALIWTAEMVRHVPVAHRRMTERVPTDIHKAIGVLLEYVGNTEGAGDLEDAWNLVREWWEQTPVGGESGVDPYPD
jgi:hypothetical protein